jgi:putative membrane protein
MRLISAFVAIGMVIAIQAAAQTPSTQDFVTKVAISDMFEIQSSQLAETKGDTGSKAFAQRMIKDHGKTSAELKAMAGKLKVKLPTALDDKHQKMLAQLGKLDGNKFDGAYDQMQVQAHEEAVKLFSSYAKNGDNAELKAWAAKTLPALQHHLEMAKKLK